MKQIREILNSNNVPADFAPYSRKLHGAWYWVAPRACIKAGYSIKTFRLTSTDPLERASMCRDLTRDVIDWYDGNSENSREKLRLDQLRDCIHQMVKNAKRRSSVRNITFEIDTDYIEGILELQEFKCALTDISFDPRPNRTGSFRNPWLPSLDRIDEQNGYTKDNVRLVTVIANYARNEFGDDAFYRMCKGAVKVRGK